MTDSPGNRARVPPWAPHVLVIVVALLVVAWFVLQVPVGMPMPDPYIYFAYARNLATGFELTFNPGLTEGFGSTTALWVFILAFFDWLGIPLELAALVLGVGLLASCGMLVYDLAKRLLPDYSERRQTTIAIAASLLAVVPGSVVWLALSGMETLLFLFLALLALKLYVHKRWYLLGAALGLLALTRIEGLILAGAIALVELAHQRRIPTDVIKSLVALFIILAPWILYLWYREGAPFTSSLRGRMLFASEAESRVSGQFPFLAKLLRLNPLVFASIWIVFILLYISGASGMPGPQWELERMVLGNPVAISVIGIAVGLVVCTPLLFLAFRHIWRRRRYLSLDKPSHRLLLVMIVWVGLHNLAYALYLPRSGAAGRYVPMNHVLFWVLLLIGVMSLQRPRLRILAGLAVIGLLGLSLSYWQDVHKANVAFTQQVRVPAARYIDEYVPPDGRVGATDIGGLRYFARQTVIDLGGHANRMATEFYEAGGSPADYVAHERLCHLMLYSSVDGVGMDFAEELGLKDDARFDLVAEASFEVPVDEWLLGSGPLRNYMPAVVVYRVDWNGPSQCAAAPADPAEKP